MILLHVARAVFIGPSAVIVGQIEIADGIAIGANSYVAKSFTEPDITIAGVPARKVSNRSGRDRFIQATRAIIKSAAWDYARLVYQLNHSNTSNQQTVRQARSA